MEILKAILKFVLRFAAWGLAIAVLVFIWGRVKAEFKAKQDQALAQTQEVQDEKFPVEIEPVRLGEITEEVVLGGEVQAPVSVEVMSKVQGRIDELRLEDGTAIEIGLHLRERGERVALIEHDDLAAQVAQAEAAVVSAQAQLAQVGPLVAEVEAGVRSAKAQVASARAAVSQAESGVRTAEARLVSLRVHLANLEKDRNRLGNLYKEGVATRKQLDDIETRHEAAKADYLATKSRVVEARAAVAATEAGAAAAEALVGQAEAGVKVAAGGREVAEAGVKQAEAALRLAQIRLSEATIRCPVAGVVSVKHMDEGDMVSPGAPIITVIGIDPVKVLVDVSEKDLSKVVAGTTSVTIATGAYPDREFQGKVTRVHPCLDTDRRTVPVETEVPNGDGLLKPGMFARVKLVLQRREGVPVIPASAIVRGPTDNYVYILNSTKAKRRPVELGLRQGDRVQITSGLSEGESIVVRGQGSLFEGAEVELVTEVSRDSEPEQEKN